MADKNTAPPEQDAPRSWFQRLRERAWNMTTAIVNYLPMGLISAAVMVGGATAIGQTGMLGETVSGWIGSMGATNGELADGGMKIFRMLLIGSVFTGVLGMTKKVAGHPGPAACPASPPCPRTSPELGQQRAQQQEYAFAANPNQGLPLNKNARAPGQPDVPGF